MYSILNRRSQYTATQYVFINGRCPSTNDYNHREVEITSNSQNGLSHTEYLSQWRCTKQSRRDVAATIAVAGDSSIDKLLNQPRNIGKSRLVTKSVRESNCFRRNV